MANNQELITSGKKTLYTSVLVEQVKRVQENFPAVAGTAGGIFIESAELLI